MLIGSGAIGTGNALNNVLTGNAAPTTCSTARAGTDTMAGGAGQRHLRGRHPRRRGHRSRRRRHRHRADRAHLHAGREPRTADADRHRCGQRHRQHAEQHADRQRGQQRSERRQRQRHAQRRHRQRHAGRWQRVRPPDRWQRQRHLRCSTARSALDTVTDFAHRQRHLPLQPWRRSGVGDGDLLVEDGQVVGGFGGQAASRAARSWSSRSIIVGTIDAGQPRPR